MIFNLFTQNGVFDFSGYLSFLMVAFLAFAYHEFAHAWTADWLGDPTPRSYGRLTLNPFPHIDPVGFVLLALFGFGWATTPISPHMLRGNPRQSHAIVSVAGPVANLLMAIAFALAFRVSIAAGLESRWVLQFFFTGIWLNCLLCIFNLLPVPPLDGFSILLGILPPDLAYQLEPLRQYGLYMFLLLFLILPVMGIGVVGQIFTYAFQLAFWMAGTYSFFF
jgi:Zn-dependent protease